MSDSHDRAYQGVYASPVGRLGIRLGESGRLQALDNLPGDHPDVPAAPACRPVLAALARYFADAGASLDIELDPLGTPFQQRVWAALRHIPAGQVRTYGELAAELGSAPRPVGQACRRNPIPILIPCHRVVARSGAGGYAGATAGRWPAVKQWLLAHEGGPAERTPVP